MTVTNAGMFSCTLSCTTLDARAGSLCAVIVSSPNRPSVVLMLAVPSRVPALTLDGSSPGYPRLNSTGVSSGTACPFASRMTPVVTETVSFTRKPASPGVPNASLSSDTESSIT
jgi:hypothetical protein